MGWVVGEVGWEMGGCDGHGKVDSCIDKMDR